VRLLKALSVLAGIHILAISGCGSGGGGGNGGGSNTTTDAVKPTVTAFVIPSSSNSLTVSVAGLTATDNVAVTGYMITENAMAPSVSAAGWTATAPASFTFSGNGARTAYAWAKDAAGNVSNGASANVTITLPAPNASLTTIISASQAVSTLNVSGVSTNICGYDADLVFPAGATFLSAVASGVANGNLMATNIQGNTLTLASASGSGFPSGEVATITFDISGVAGSVQSSDFSVSSFTPGNCL
jgi:hypothetical protein